MLPALWLAPTRRRHDKDTTRLTTTTQHKRRSQRTPFLRPPDDKAYRQSENTSITRTDREASQTPIPPYLPDTTHPFARPPIHRRTPWASPIHTSSSGLHLAHKTPHVSREGRKSTPTPSHSSPEALSRPTEGKEKDKTIFVEPLVSPVEKHPPLRDLRASGLHRQLLGHALHPIDSSTAQAQSRSTRADHALYSLPFQIPRPPTHTCPRPAYRTNRECRDCAKAIAIAPGYWKGRRRTTDELGSIVFTHSPSHRPSPPLKHLPPTTPFFFNPGLDPADAAALPCSRPQSLLPTLTNNRRPRWVGHHDRQNVALSFYERTRASQHATSSPHVY